MKKGFGYLTKSQLKSVSHDPKDWGGVIHKQRGLNKTEKKQVNKLINKKFELKFFTQAYFQTVPISVVPQQMSVVPQAITDSARIGDTMTMKSIQIRGQLEKATLDVLDSNYVRVIIFQWHPNTVNLTPTNAQLFLNDPSTASIMWRSFYIKDNREQFTILYDRIFKLTGFLANNNGTTQSSYVINQFVKIRFMKKIIQFSNASVNGENQIYLTTLGTSATNPPSLQLSFRFNYTDA